ncbi:ParB/RepB/Spo0J family partition protein [Vibrio parahaemolyticus]
MTTTNIQKAIATATATATGVALASKDGLRKLSGNKDIEVKRVNGFNADPRLLWIEEGFNVRDIDAEHVEGFVRSYTDGKYVPPIEVVVVEVDGVQRLKVVEGHHRTVAIYKAIESGVDLKAVSVIEVTGNEVDQLARMIKSAEGRPLTAIELANAYNRMMGMGLNQTQVAEELGTTPAQVNNYLLLLKAPQELKAMIQAGDYSATNAWNNIRKHGADIALAMAKEEVRAKSEKKAAKEKGEKPAKSTGTSALKKIKLAPKKVNSMGDIVSSLASQVTLESLEEEKEVKLTMTAEMAKKLLSLAAELDEIETHNAKADQMMKELAVKAKQDEKEGVILEEKSEEQLEIAA